MKKQKKQLVFMLLVLVVLAASYLGLQRYNKVQEEAALDDTTELLLDQISSDIDSSQVTELSYYFGEELCSLVKEEDIWKFKEDRELTLKQSTITTMVASVTGTNIVSRLEDVTDLSEYGLAEPSNVITVMVQGTEHVIKVGNSNPVTSYLYVQLDDSSTVYVVSSGMPNSFNHAMDDLVEEETIEADVTEEISEPNH